MGGRFQDALTALREGGPRLLWHRSRKFAQENAPWTTTIRLAVELDDVLRADVTHPQPVSAGERRRTGDRLVVSWILPPCRPGSGGHETIYRFVRHLESRGHVCRLYFYDPEQMFPFPDQVAIVQRSFRPMAAEILPLGRSIAPCDALFATSWPTAYPTYNLAVDAKKFYLVQDYEPLFFPAGSESMLAANTYRLGLYGITAGRWLAERLTQEYGMVCEPFEFGADHDVYTNRNAVDRDGVLFYARPSTPRRGFELGSLALELFHREFPECPIHLLGWDVSHYRLRFPFVHHGVLDLEALNDLYNRCRAGLVISLTNMSLLPLELLAAGCIPVVNDTPGNRLVANNAFIVYADGSPHGLAAALRSVVSLPDAPTHAAEASASVQGITWESACMTLENIVLREVGALDG